MFRYPCPDCRSTTVLHRRDCQFENADRATIERAYVDILAGLSDAPRTRDDLQASIDQPWSGLHETILRGLDRDARVEVESGGGTETISLVPPDEIADRLEPTDDPLKTIYERGSVAGAHDNSVFAMIAYYGSKGLSWPDTRQQVLDWLHESGTWARGGFEERSPEALVDAKRHVHSQGYGWLEKAKAAKRVIDDSSLGGT